MAESELWWSSMAVTSQPQPDDVLRITWVDDPPGTLDLHRYDGWAKTNKVITLSAEFAKFSLENKRYRVEKITRKTPMTAAVERSEVTIELHPVLEEA